MKKVRIIPALPKKNKKLKVISEWLTKIEFYIK